MGSAEPDFVAAIGAFELADSLVVKKSAGELGFAKPDPAWDGQGTAMDSVNFPDNGFSSARIAR